LFLRRRRDDDSGPVLRFSGFWIIWCFHVWLTGSLLIFYCWNFCRNNEIQFAGQLEPNGCQFTLKVPISNRKVLVPFFFSILDHMVFILLEGKATAMISSSFLFLDCSLDARGEEEFCGCDRQDWIPVAVEMLIF
jgi:hypothetical protein